MDNRGILRSALGISLVTIASRVFGLLREWLRGYLLGTSASSDAFSIAFMMPNLLRRLVGEGAMTAAFIPVFSDYLERGDREKIDDFVHSFFTLVFLFLVILVAAALFAAPVLKYFLPAFTRVPGKIQLTVYLTRLMFPYIFFISLAALTQAILNTFKVFLPSAATPILLNASIITVGLLLGRRVSDPAVALGIGVIAGGVIQFAFQLPYLFRKNIGFRFSLHFTNPGVRKVFLLMVPGTIGAGVYQINAFVSQLIAARLQGGSVAALRFSNVLVEVVLGGFIISVSTVILPALSEKSSKGDREGMMQNLRFALRLVALITLPAAFGLIVLREPIVRMLFQYGSFTSRSTELVTYALLFQAPGLAGVGATRVVVQMFFAMKDTRTPVYVAAVSMAVNLALCYYLSIPLSLGGIALAGSISAVLNFLLLIIILKSRIGPVVDAEITRCALKSLAASAVMAGALHLLLGAAAGEMARSRLLGAGYTILLILAGLALFFGMNILLKNRDLIRLWKLFLRRLQNRR
jgi:putative peptidoglycan lipid II flippase